MKEMMQKTRYELNRNWRKGYELKKKLEKED